MIDHDNYTDRHIRSILRRVKTVAIVGASGRDIRPSFFVFKYLASKGYGLYAVNPGLAGRTILGRPVVKSLSDIPEPVDMIDIFRNSEAAGPIVDEALQLDPKPKVIWMQLGVRNDEAAARAESAGVEVVMNRCPKIEYGRLCGEIAWSGVNTRRISSRRPVTQQGFQHLGLGKDR